jgi:hypothetical protein
MNDVMTSMNVDFPPGTFCIASNVRMIDELERNLEEVVMTLVQQDPNSPETKYKTGTVWPQPAGFLRLSGVWT